MAYLDSVGRTINRRDFLRMLGATTSWAMLPLGMEHLYSPAADQPVVPIPPSLMLHSLDGKVDFLPPLLESLQTLGFTTTTYQGWYESVLTNRPVERSIILSIDDLTLVEGNNGAFETFVQMKDWIQAAGETAVFGIITNPIVNGQPQRGQDESRWDMMQAWVEAGFELATHTTYHSNFNALDTGPRPDFTAVDYEAEIVDSTRLIEAKLVERQISYRVETLILPFGSGYSYQLPQPAVHPGITAACAQTNIKFVVGIAHGREPLPGAEFLNPQMPVYAGRIPPAYITDSQNSHRQPDPILTAAWLQSW